MHEMGLPPACGCTTVDVCPPGSAFLHASAVSSSVVLTSAAVSPTNTQIRPRRRSYSATPQGLFRCGSSIITASQVREAKPKPDGLPGKQYPAPFCAKPNSSVPPLHPLWMGFVLPCNNNHSGYKPCPVATLRMSMAASAPTRAFQFVPESVVPYRPERIAQIDSARPDFIAPLDAPFAHHAHGQRVGFGASHFFWDENASGLTPLDRTRGRRASEPSGGLFP